jgi:hypothetical protein
VDCPSTTEASACSVVDATTSSKASATSHSATKAGTTIDAYAKPASLATSEATTTT